MLLFIAHFNTQYKVDYYLITNELVKYMDQKKILNIIRIRFLRTVKLFDALN